MLPQILSHLMMMDFVEQSKTYVEYEKINTVFHTKTMNKIISCGNNNINYNIISLHGRETVKEFHQLDRSRQKISKGTEMLTFLKRCRSTRTTPDFAKIIHHPYIKYADISTRTNLDLIRDLY